MSQPRASVHAILFLGAAGAGIVMFLMMVSLGDLEKTQAGTRAKLGNAAKEKFGYDLVTTEFVEAVNDRNQPCLALVVECETRKPSGFETEAIENEMRDVFRFMYQESLKYKDEELYRTEVIRVKRTEIRGSGCFQDRFPNEKDYQVPKRRKEDEFRPGTRDPRPRNP